ncbi:MAG: hypothetical protein M3Y59_12520 [Myxococcota bacterium]|nr:hypothetical protein [Myxococcota bacterium]
MNPERVATLVWNMAGIAALLVALYWALVPTLRAEFRHELFAIRRKLFDVMQAGQVSRRDPAYTAFRQTLNGLLRRAEDITGFQVVLITFAMRGQTEESSAAMDRDVDLLPTEEGREAIRNLHKETTAAVFRHIVRIVPVSPMLWPFAMLALLIYGVSGLRKASLKARVVRGLELEAAKRAEVAEERLLAAA